MLWNIKEGCVQLQNTWINYVSFGYGERNLILLPGLSDGLATVKGKAALLAPSYRMFFERYMVYIFSRRDMLPEGFSIADMANDQANAMRKLGMGPACFVGVSQGGMIAQLLTIHHPELVQRLGIAVSAANANPMVQNCVNHWIELAREGNHRRLMEDTAQMSYSYLFLKKYRWMLLVLGFVGKPRSYDRFRINAQAILQYDGRESWDSSRA